MATIARLGIDILANTASLTKGVNDATGSINKIVSVAKVAGAALGAMFAVDKILQAGKAFLDFTGELTDLSAKTGIGTTALQKLKYAAEQNGGSLDLVTGAITKMSEKLVNGDKGAVAAFNQLGLKIGDLRKMKPEEAFATIADAIAGVKDPMGQAALSMEIFEKKGADMLPMMKGNFKELGNQAEKMGLILSEDVVAAGDQFGDTLGMLMTAGMALLGKVLGPFIPALTLTVEALLQVANVIGSILGPAMEVLVAIGMKVREFIISLVQKLIDFAMSIPGVSSLVEKLKEGFSKLKEGAGNLYTSIVGVKTASDSTAKSVGQLENTVKPLKGTHDAAAKAASDHAKAIASIRDSLSGQGAIKAALDMLEAIKGTIPIQHMTREAQDKINKTMDAALDVFEKLGVQAPNAIRDIWAATNNLVPQIPVVNGLGKALEQVFAGRAADGAFPGVVKDLGEGLKGVGQQVDITIVKFDRIKPTLQALAATLTQTFASGGSIGKALASFGEGLVHSIVTPLRKGLLASLDLAIEVGGAISSGVGSAAGGQAGATIGALASSIGGLAAAKGAFGASIAASSVSVAAMATGIGAAAVGAYLLIRHFAGISKEVKEARANVASFEDALVGTLSAQQKAAAGGVRWKEVTIAVRDAYLLVGRTADEALQMVQQLWDTGNPARAAAAQQEIAVVMAMAETKKSIVGLVQEYLGAGVTIPESIQKSIDQLIKMGKLTAENAAELLGLKDAAVPSLDEIQAAAGRYGKTLDDLGPKVRQLQMNETAQQILKDFDTLMRATEDLGLVMSIQRDKVQGLVKEALELGLSLPSSMKGLIENMIAAGLLTDEFGQKLTDVGRLTFVDTLQDKIDRLIGKLGDLVDALNGVGRAASGIGAAAGVADTFADSPSFAAGGGIVGLARVIPFARGGLVKSIGTDTVPAMLTPGELVLNAAQQRNIGRAIGGGSLHIGQIVVNSKSDDPRQVAEEVAREIIRKQRREQRLNAA